MNGGTGFSLSGYPVLGSGAQPPLHSPQPQPLLVCSRGRRGGPPQPPPPPPPPGVGSAPAPCPSRSYTPSTDGQSSRSANTPLPNTCARFAADASDAHRPDSSSWAGPSAYDEGSG